MAGSRTASTALRPFAAVGGLIAGFYAALTLPGELAVAGPWCLLWCTELVLGPLLGDALAVRYSEERQDQRLRTFVPALRLVCFQPVPRQKRHYVVRRWC